MTLEPKINKETAEADVNRWLDLKKIPLSLRQDNKKAFDQITYGVMHDAISIDDKGVITHKLNFPIEDAAGNEVCQCLKYKLRLTSDELTACIEAGNDIKVYGAALTSGTPSAYFGKLDTTDVRILSAIIAFFSITM